MTNTTALTAGRSNTNIVLTKVKYTVTEEEGAEDRELGLPQVTELKEFSTTK